MWSLISQGLRLSGRKNSNNNNNFSPSAVEGESAVKGESASLPALNSNSSVSLTENNYANSQPTSTQDNNTLPQNNDVRTTHGAQRNVSNFSNDSESILPKMEEGDIDGIAVNRSEADLRNEVGIKQEGTQQNISDESIINEEFSWGNQRCPYGFGSNYNYTAQSSSNRRYTTTNSVVAASSPRRSVSATHQHTIPKNTPGRSKALRSESGKIIASCSTASNNPPVVHRNTVGYDLQYNQQQNNHWQHQTHSTQQQYTHLSDHQYIQQQFYPHRPIHKQHMPHNHMHNNYPFSSNRYQYPPPMNYATQSTSQMSYPVAPSSNMISNNAMSQVDESTARRLTSEELRQALPWCIHQRGNYILRECRAVFGGQETGYSRPFNSPENDALYDQTNGMVTKYIPMSVLYYNTKRIPTETQRVQDFGHSSFNCEVMKTVQCKENVRGCNCKGQIWRIQYGITKGLLYYEMINPDTNCPFVHENHSAAKGRTPYSLTTQQEEFVIKCSQGKTPDIRDQRRLAQVMIRNNDIATSEAQKNNVEEFVKKIGEFIANSKRGNKVHKSYFQQQKVDDSTTGAELQELLNHLMSDKDSDKRRRKFSLDGIGLYILTFDGELVQNLIRVHEHDHNGKTWSYITFEYLHANDLAKLAVTMYPDGKLKLEMDFFMSVCKGNQWQVGHIGLSDRDHKYWILCVIIAKSENHKSAGLLLKRATELLHDANGDGRCVLVDGGKALDKAVDKENEERVDNALEDIRDGGGMLLDLEHDESNTHAAMTVEVEDEVGESQINAICDEIVEAFIGQTNDDEGDVQGRKNLEERLRKLLKSHQLLLMRCLAHIVRNAGTRGAGWRGGKGSLCRALLNGGCSKKKMQQVRDTNAY